MMWFGWMALGALAADDDLSVTSLGTQAFRAQTIGVQSMDLLVGQRLRWTLANDVRALVDGRFLADPTATLTFEESRVREVAIALDADAATLMVGRTPLLFGSRRLVDGVQALAHPGAAHQWSLGAWAGLVPDEFTTAPTTRFGAGPMIAYDRASGSVSAAGDIVVGSGGLQRLGAQAFARGELGSRFQASSRLDLVFDDGAGHSGLADGAVFLQYRPAPVLRLDGFYDAYSTLLYQSRASTNPWVQRFATRIEQLGLTEGITQDFIDPTLHHVLGVTARTAATGAVRPILQLSARNQMHADPQERYARLGALTGVGGLLDERVEIDLDGNALWIDGAMGGDAGITLFLEPVPDAVASVDTSVRALFDPVDFSGKPGWYADLFLDFAARSGTVLSAGGSWTAEPSDVVGTDVGISAFLRLQQWVRPGRSAPSTRSPSGSPPGTGGLSEPPRQGEKLPDSTEVAESDNGNKAKNQGN